MGETRSVGIHFGALSPSIEEQLAEQGITLGSNALEKMQGDANSVTRLHLRGLLTDSQAHQARRKLLNRIIAAAEEAPPGDAP